MTPEIALHDQPPVSVMRADDRTWLLDFGRVAFGNLRIDPPSARGADLVVHLGEASREGRVHRQPPGSVRYARIPIACGGHQPVVVAPSANPQHVHPSAVRTPSAWGNILPFRWVEIEGWPRRAGPPDVIRQAAFLNTWDDEASSFTSSDAMLNRIWDLCRYTIKATTYAGVYVDGDRERIAYEGDAYINQLCHYAVDRDTTMARATMDRLLALPTWPSEWTLHLPLMAHADWMHTGEADWVTTRYDALKSRLLQERVRPDGLLGSTEAHIAKGDLVDWPPGERDGFVFTPVNAVVNAFRIRALAAMAELAVVAGSRPDARLFAAQARSAIRVYQALLLDRTRGRFRDGEGTDHTSWHANGFALAAGLAPAALRAGIAAWIAQRGMAGSVYAAFHVLDALFENGAGDQALALIAAPGDRSWRHMVDAGTTITWEAWDQCCKPNQDWNHAWGAAPAWLLPRHVLGVRPMKAGWSQILIRPNHGTLTHAQGTVPTPLGPVEVAWSRDPAFRLRLAVPRGMTARIELPAARLSRGIRSHGRPVPARRAAGRWVIESTTSGTWAVDR